MFENVAYGRRNPNDYQKGLLKMPWNFFRSRTKTLHRNSVAAAQPRPMSRLEQRELHHLEVITLKMNKKNIKLEANLAKKNRNLLKMQKRIDTLENEEWMRRATHVEKKIDDANRPTAKKDMLTSLTFETARVTQQMRVAKNPFGHEANGLRMKRIRGNAILGLTKQTQSQNQYNMLAQAMDASAIACTSDSVMSDSECLSRDLRCIETDAADQLADTIDYITAFFELDTGMSGVINETFGGQMTAKVGENGLQFMDWLGAAGATAMCVRAAVGACDELPNNILVQSDSLLKGFSKSSVANKKTHDYMLSRQAKTAAAAWIDFGGKVASAGTAADVSAAKDANSVISTGFHIVEMEKIWSKYYRSLGKDILKNWVLAARIAKGGKGALRLSLTITKSIPGGGVWGAAATAGTSIAKIFRQKSIEEMVLKSAIQCHYFAMREQAYKKGALIHPDGWRSDLAGNGAQPATEVFKSMCARKSLLRIFGNYDLDAIIREPAGYLVFSDKAMLV